MQERKDGKATKTPVTTLNELQTSLGAMGETYIQQLLHRLFASLKFMGIVAKIKLLLKKTHIKLQLMT